MNIPIGSYDAVLEITKLHDQVRADDLAGQAYLAMLYAIVSAKYQKAFEAFLAEK